MRVIKKDLKHNTLKIVIENEDDLYWLYLIIKCGDYVVGKAMRKLKIGDENSTRSIKKRANIKLSVEEVKLQLPRLRIHGLVEEGPEEFNLHSHQSINLDIGDSITITKKKWLDYELKKIEELSRKKIGSIGLVVFDRDNLLLTIIKGSRINVIEEIRLEHQSKYFKDKIVTNERVILDGIKKLIKRDIKIVILATQSIWMRNAKKVANELNKELEDKNNIRIIFSTVSGANRCALKEIMKKTEIKKAISYLQEKNDFELIDELLKRIDKGSRYAYGEKEVKNAINNGAVEMLLITDSYIKRVAEVGKSELENLNEMISLAESMKATVHIINTENEAGIRLEKLGGIAGLLRF